MYNFMECASDSVHRQSILGTHDNNTTLSAHSLLEHTNATVLMINVALYDILGHRAPDIHQKAVGSHRSVPV